MAHRISGGINLMRLEGVKPVRVANEEGVFIPFRQAKITKNEKGAWLNLFIFEHKDKFDHDYLCVRAKTKQEADDNVKSPILGNFSTLKGSERYEPKPEISVEEMPPSSKKNDYDDDPF